MFVLSGTVITFVMLLCLPVQGFVEFANEQNAAQVLNRLQNLIQLNAVVNNLIG